MKNEYKFTKLERLLMWALLIESLYISIFM